jgi:Lon protease-like protein
MKSIQQQQLSLPPHLPVMFLPNTAMLPHVLLPLFIFEPRYRAMLAHCLEQHRMFCVALMQPGVSEARTSEDFHDVAGLGLVRACVAHEDGTSHLVLQGLARVRVREFVQEKPFRIAAVQELSSIPSDDPELPALNEQIRKLAATLLPAAGSERQKLNDQLAEIEDTGMLSDVVAHTFLRAAPRQQQILEELNVAARARKLVRLIGEEMSE